ARHGGEPLHRAGRADLRRPGHGDPRGVGRPGRVPRARLGLVSLGPVRVWISSHPLKPRPLARRGFWRNGHVSVSDTGTWPRATAGTRPPRPRPRRRILGPGLSRSREPEDDVERAARAGPQLADDRGSHTVQDAPEPKGDDERVVDLTGDRNEVRDEVEREGEVSRDRPEQDLLPARNSLVAEQAAEQD